MKPLQWEVLVPIVFALTLTQVGGAGVAKLFALSNAETMQRVSKVIEICTAYTVVVSGSVLYFAWGSLFPDPGAHGKEMLSAFLSQVLLPALATSPIAVTGVIGSWQLLRWTVVEFHRDVVIPSWELARHDWRRS